MEEIAAKLTNLSYEIFGIILPGAIGLAFFIIYWWSLGSIPPRISQGTIPEMTYSFLRNINFDATDAAMGLILIYFIGHIIFWLSRNHSKKPELENKQEKAKGSLKKLLLYTSISAKRVASCLRFRIPRPENFFDSVYRPMMVQAANKLGIPDDDDTWKCFFPLAKVILAHRLVRSLVSTYQNKYTMHRSITAAAALLFWTSVLTIIAVLVANSVVGGILQPRWWGLIANAVGAIGLVWGFSDSFAYNWRLFGNTIITESYAVLAGEVDRKKQIDEVLVKRVSC